MASPSKPAESNPEQHLQSIPGTATMERFNQIMLSSVQHGIDTQLLLIQLLTPAAGVQQTIEQEMRVLEGLRRNILDYQKDLLLFTTGLSRAVRTQLAQAGSDVQRATETQATAVRTATSAAQAQLRPVANLAGGEAVPQAPTEFLQMWKTLIWDPMCRQIAEASATAAKAGRQIAATTESAGKRAVPAVERRISRPPERRIAQRRNAYRLTAH